MAKPKNDKAADKAVIVTNRSILKEPAAEEPVKEPLLTAPVLPSSSKKSKATATAEAPANDDSAQTIQVKRVAVKPLPAKEPAEEASADPARLPEVAKPEELPKVQPLQETKSETVAEPNEAPEAKPEAASPPKPETEPPEPPRGKPAEPVDLEAEAKQQAEHEAAVQKLVDSKKYFLPINAVEQRRSKRFVALGVVLSILLLLAWADIAVDAGLIQIDGVQPVTHFFSN